MPDITLSEHLRSVHLSLIPEVGREGECITFLKDVEVTHTSFVKDNPLSLFILNTYVI